MNFLSIVWTNEPLQWVIIFVFIGAVCWELLTTLKYQRESLKTTREAIGHLKKNKDARDIFKSTDDRNLLDWIRYHISGKESQKQNERFILLHYPVVLARSAPQSDLRFIPTICTALGLLGTFYGIQKGLQGINPGINESQDLINASKDLFAGMRTAFSNSLAGLGAASLFTLVIFGNDWYRQKKRKSLQKELDKIAFLEAPSKANNEAATQLTSAAKNLQSLTSQDIGSEVGKALKPIFEEIRDELTVLRQIKGEQGQEVLQNLILSLRNEVIEPIVEQLNQSTNLTKEVSVSVKSLTQELGGVSTSLAGSINTIQTFQEETVGNLDRFAQSLQQTLGQFQNETQGVLQQVAQEIHLGVAESVRGMESQRNAFEESANQASVTFRGIRENLQEALRTQAEQQKEMLQGVQSQTLEILNQANTTFKEQSNTIQTVGAEASSLMKDAKDNLIDGLSNIDGMMRNTSQMVRTELEQFRLNYQDSLEQFFTEQNNLLEGSLGEQRKGLAEVVANLERVFSEEAERRRQLNQSMDKIQETVKVVNELATAVGLNSEQQKLRMKEFVRELSQDVQRVEQQYYTYTNKLEEILQSWSNNLVTSQSKFFNDADSAMAKVSGGLLEAANVLVAAENNYRLINSHNKDGKVNL